MTYTVLLTDRAWPDDEIEREIIESAGLTLLAGPASPASPEEIEDLVRIHQPGGILTCWAPVTAAAMRSAPELKIVARLGVGLDNIAVDAATALGVWVTNVPDYCVEEVSDHAVGFALAWTRGLIAFDRSVRAGTWNPASAKLRRLANMTVGILGFGRIGRATSRKLAGFGCRIVAHDPFASEDAPSISLVSMTQLLIESDIVIVHAPLTKETRHLINGESLSAMKPGGLLINVSRGAVVETEAVVAALRSGHLSAAALDVIESEPHVPQQLLDCDGAFLTPHVAFSSDASLLELRQRATKEVVQVLQGAYLSNRATAPRFA